MKLESEHQNSKIDNVLFELEMDICDKLVQPLNQNVILKFDNVGEIKDIIVSQVNVEISCNDPTQPPRK